MKKISLIIIGIFLVTFTFAQNYLDALRYSQFFPTGTARNLSVGGSFGTFGGDMSAFYTNPAGLGVYRKSEITITPGYNYLNSVAKYYERSTEDFIHKISLDNIGFVSSLNKKSEGLVGISFGVAYNKLKDFNNNIIISGNNNFSSFVDYFRWNANGLSPDNLNGYWEWLAYDGMLIDTMAGSGRDYIYESKIPNKVYQRRTINTKGSVGDWAFAFGLNYNNKLYIGGGLSIIKLNYSEVSEQYDQNYLFESDFNDFTFIQELSARGTGVNFKLGLIARPVEFIRIGASLQTPTWYSIEDVFYTKLYSTFNNHTYTALPIDFDGSMLGDLVTNYKLVTPFKSTGSLGFQFGKFGLLSFEAEYINYASMRLREGYDGYGYFDENSEIGEVFRDVLNLKTGGEIRIDNIAFRGGFAYYPSPYEKGELNQNSGNTSISAGIGFRDKNFFIDLGSAYMMHDAKYNLYSDPGGDNIADLKLNNLRLLATIGFRF